jgi:hypothetical protein
LPARRCIPAITGAAVSVLIVVASGERPLRRICLPGRGVLEGYMAAFERSDTDFESLLATHPTIAGRWLSWVAGRLAASQARILGLLGRNLSAQVAQLLLDEQHDGTVELAQRTLAAWLGVQRPSLNKVLKTSNATDSSPSATPPSTCSTPPGSPAWPPDDPTIRWLCSAG